MTTTRPFTALMAAGLLATALPVPARADEKPVLTVYTYDSFVSEWGPGPAVETAFEETCACDLQFIGSGDGAALLSRLLLEGAEGPADIALGLDTNLTAAAAQSGLFANHALADIAYDLPVAWADPVFVPYDWGYLAFVRDTARTDAAPATFEELAASNLRIVIQDPRSSTPGLGLLMWVKSAYGPRAAEIWAALADNIVTVTPGWSEAYGLFLAGEADLVLSYTTSPAYHLIAESDAGKAALPFAEGHYLQIEVAAKLASSDQVALADAFLEFMASDAFQEIIPETNWMYPALTPAAGLPDAFSTLIVPEKALLLSAEDAANIKDEALAEWREALSR